MKKSLQLLKFRAKEGTITPRHITDCLNDGYTLSDLCEVIKPLRMPKHALQTLWEWNANH